MNEEREGGMCLIATIGWALLMVVLVIMCSCGSKKIVTEYVAVHDTLQTYHTDTVSVEKWSWRHDTLRIETERVVTLLQSDKTVPAETIRVETNNWHWQHEVVRDSSERIVARVDSILRALDKQREKETVKKQPAIDWWQYMAVVAVIGIAMFFISRVKIGP